MRALRPGTARYFELAPDDVAWTSGIAFGQKMKTAPCDRGAVPGCCDNAPRLFGHVDVFAVDHFQDRARAGAVAPLIHRDLAGDAGKVFQAAEAVADLVAVVLEL